MRTLALLATFVALLLTCAPALAGHSRYPYCDAGQSADGRYTVTPELVEEPAAGKKPAAFHWKYTWKDTKTGATHTGKLEGLRSGKNSVSEPVHAHTFVAPNGDTFAVWNPNVLAPTMPSQGKWPDLTSAEAREWSGFSHRLMIYKKTGEVVTRLDLKDFLTDADWKWLFCYGRQVYWQANYPGLTRDNAPRVGYALYQISPDYTVLETLVGATEEAARKAKDNGVAVPATRTVRIDLTTGKLLDPSVKLNDPQKVPGRPFKGEVISGGRGNQANYVPSLDPVRTEGKFVAPANDNTPGLNRRLRKGADQRRTSARKARASGGKVARVVTVMLVRSNSLSQSG